MNYLVASATLFASFFVTVFRASSLVLAASSNNYIPYLLERFLLNGKNPYPLTYFLVLGSIE